MKISVAIVTTDDSAIVSSALTQDGYFVTKLSTTGGFLMVGNTTLLIGTDDNKIDRVKEILHKYSSTHKQHVPSSASFGRGLHKDGVSEEVTVNGATFFVLNVEEFGKL